MGLRLLNHLGAFDNFALSALPKVAEEVRSRTCTDAQFSGI